MGIKEKKAISAINEGLNGELGAKLKGAFGNTEIGFEVLAEDGLAANQIDIAANGIQGDIVPAFLEVAADADYREELAKISKFSFNIKNEIQKPSGYYIWLNLALNGETMEVTVDGMHAPANGTPVVVKQYIESLY